MVVVSFTKDLEGRMWVSGWKVLPKSACVEYNKRSDVKLYSSDDQNLPPRFFTNYRFYYLENGDLIYSYSKEEAYQREKKKLSLIPS